MAQRLPTPGQDDGTWGYVLNGFLGVAHDSGGNLLPAAVTAAGAEVTTNKGAASGYAPLNSSSLVPTTNLGTGTAGASNYLRGDGTWVVPASANNATTSAPGLVQLAGDLAGTATSPTVPGLTAKAPLASPTFTGTVTVPTPVNATDATTKTYVDTQVSSGTADATTSTKGKVQLAGDLAGTAAAPSVAKINGITLPGTAPTTGNVLTATSTTATAWTTPAAGVMLDTTSTDIVAGTVTGSGVAGSVGKAADAGHQHPLQAHDHTTTNKGGQVPVAGLSATGTASSSTYLRGDGTWTTPNSGSSTLAADTDVALASPTNNQVLTYNAGSSKWVNQNAPSASNATTSTPGLVQLSGDLGGTATSPTVAKVNGVTVSGTPTSGQVPTATSGTAASWATPAAGVTLDSTASDIQPDTTTGTAVAGATGKAADAGHQHTLVGHDHSSVNKGGAIPESSVTNLTTDLAATEKTANKGAASGYAPLNGSSQVPIANIPTGTTSSNVAIGNDARFAGSAAGTAGAALSATDATTTNSRAPNGSAGGDLGGTYPNPTVGKLQGAVTLSGSASANQVLTASSSSAASWVSPVVGSQALVPTAVKTSAYSAAAGDFVLCDTNSVGAFTVTLPTAPADKTRVAIKLVAVGTTSGQPNALSFVTGGSDKFNTTTGPTSGSLTLLNQAVNLQYISATSVWVVASDDLPMSQTDIRYERSAAAAVATSNIAATYSANSFAPTSATAIDGYTFAANDLILLTAQTSAVQNGLWLVPASGAWTRPSEFASGAIVRGRTVPIMNGTTNINTQWDLNVATAGVTVDTTSQTWKLAFNGTYAPFGATRSATLTVAASNSPAAAKAVADYVCTGTNDDAQIQAAVTAMASHGGKIVLLDGNYSWDGTGVSSDQNNVTIEGTGDSTYITVNSDFTGSAAFTFGVATVPTGITLRSFTLDLVPLMTAKTAPTLTTTVDAPAQGTVETVTVSSTATFGTVGGVTVSQAMVGYAAYEIWNIQSIISSTQMSVVRGAAGSQTTAWVGGAGVPITPMISGINWGAAGNSNLEHVIVKSAPGDNIFQRSYDWSVVAYTNQATTDQPAAGTTETWTVTGFPQNIPIGAVLTVGQSERVQVVTIAYTALGTTITITRGYGGTTVGAWATGTQIQKEPSTIFEAFMWSVKSYAAQANPFRLGTSYYQGSTVASCVDNVEYHKCHPIGANYMSASSPNRGHSGFYLEAAGSKFFDCHPYYNQVAGIYGSAAAQSVEIIGGEYETNGTSGNAALAGVTWGHAIYATGSIRWLVSGVRCYGNSGVYHMQFVNAPQHVTVRDPSFYSLLSTTTKVISFGGFGGSGFCLVSGMKLNGKGAAGLIRAVESIQLSEVHVTDLQAFNTSAQYADIQWNQVSGCSIRGGTTLTGGIVETNGSDKNLVDVAGWSNSTAAVSLSTSGGANAIGVLNLGASASGTVTSLTLAATPNGAITIPSGTVLSLCLGAIKQNFTTTASVTTSTSTTSSVTVTSQTASTTFTTSTVIGGWSDVWTIGSTPFNLGRTLTFNGEQVTITAQTSTTVTVTRGVSSTPQSASGTPTVTQVPYMTLTGANTRVLSRFGYKTQGSGTVTVTGGGGTVYTFAHGLNMLPAWVDVQYLGGGLASGTGQVIKTAVIDTTYFAITFGTDPGGGNNPQFEFKAYGFAL